jgi:uncharacterized repeat protein (TIGR01451 family)
MHAAPFWSPVLDPDETVTYTVRVDVPATAGAAHTTIINSWSSLPPNLAESVSLVTETRALLRGAVFDDRDHDGVRGAGDVGLAGVLVRESRSGLAATTLGDGSYAILLPADSLVVVEQNPIGFASLTPDTVVTGAIAAGDTAVVDFAEVGILTISAGGAANAPAGGFADFAHRVQARTAGHVDLSVAIDSMATTVWYVDVNGNGVIDGGDRVLAPADGDLDPDGPGAGVLNVVLRVFLSVAAAPGSTVTASIQAVQSVSGTALTLAAGATDVVVVGAAGSAQLTVQKSLDRTDAAPGDLITYSLRLFNAGVDSLANVTLVDPVSPWVDVEANAFGAGLDLQWQPPAGGTVYFTFDETDADECQYDAVGRTLRVILSRNGAFYLAPGQAGVVTYRVRVR